MLRNKKALTILCTAYHCARKYLDYHRSHVVVAMRSYDPNHREIIITSWNGKSVMFLESNRWLEIKKETRFPKRKTGFNSS